jgi:hypothetical protein
VIETVGGKEVGEDIICLIEIEVTKRCSLGPLKTIFIINLPLFWIR